MSQFRFVLALALVVPALAHVALGADEGKTAQRVVIVPQDANPFKVEIGQIVRLSGEGVSGSKIVAGIDGPARVVAEDSVLTVKNGHVLIGMKKVEFVIKPTGRGTVKVKITTTFLKNEPSVKNHEFEVK
jgi:hypothetical protein